tara:strand:+ start:292 stop:447 length:156 start_codon:yes stop_codon:yes gene_type:complete
MIKQLISYLVERTKTLVIKIENRMEPCANDTYLTGGKQIKDFYIHTDTEEK